MSFVFDPLQRGAYDVVMIDPPWPWRTWSDKGAAKSPSAHYDCMTLEVIAALPVAELLAPGGVAFVFCTFPLIGYQHLIVEQWGLKVSTGGVWAKRTINGKRRLGLGKVKRSVCEPYLIAARDERHRLRARGAAWNLIESFDRAEVDGLAREHSRKPDEVYRDIEEQTPGWRRADVFARQRRDGWDGWGHELEKFPGIAGANKNTSGKS